MEHDPIMISDDDSDVKSNSRRTMAPPTIPDTNIDADVELRDGSFLRITGHKRDIGGRLWLQGCNLVKPTIETHCLDLEEHEVVWIQEFVAQKKDERRSDRVITHREYLARDVVRNVRVVFTNQLYHSLNYSIDRQAGHETRKPLLFCRMKRIMPPQQKASGTTGTPPSRHLKGAVVMLRAEEADSEARVMKDSSRVACQISNLENRDRSREFIPTQLFGSSCHASASDTVRQYTYADGFSGAGGASQGAYDAGLKLEWAFDMGENAMASYSTNFAHMGTRCLLETATAFLARVRANPGAYRVDILHLSPPCQPFSAANTTPNQAKNDENHATFTTVEDLIREVKPRIVTIEEANALEWPRHREWFVKIQSMFIGLGYSVRWEVIQLSDYGVPQTRKRLMMIGSCPGERLPPIPMPTHGDPPLPHPKPTILEALQGIPLGALHHNLATTTHFAVPKTPINENDLSGTIKCGGNSDNVYYFDGTRGYTVRELATLQTFPHGFEFVGSNTQKTAQIGNAVPPRAAKNWFGEIVEFLFQSDAEDMVDGGSVA